MGTWFVSYRRFQNSTEPISTNIVHADCEEAVDREFAKCAWYSAREAKEHEVKAAKAKGMPERTVEMGWYSSENTRVLATHMASGGNKRMLLLHETGDGNRPYEYVIGSYFQERRYEGALGYERTDYEWDWGHYFSDVVSAVGYWKRNVLGESYGFEAYDERSGFSEGELFDELGDAIDAYVRWDFADGGSRKRIFSVEGDEEVTLAESRL